MRSNVTLPACLLGKVWCTPIKNWCLILPRVECTLTHVIRVRVKTCKFTYSVIHLSWHPDMFTWYKNKNIPTSTGTYGYVNMYCIRPCTTCGVCTYVYVRGNVYTFPEVTIKSRYMHNNKNVNIFLLRYAGVCTPRLGQYAGFISLNITNAIYPAAYTFIVNLVYTFMLLVFFGVFTILSPYMLLERCTSEYD